MQAQYCVLSSTCSSRSTTSSTTNIITVCYTVALVVVLVLILLLIVCCIAVVGQASEKGVELIVEVVDHFVFALSHLDCCFWNTRHSTVQYSKSKRAERVEHWWETMHDKSSWNMQL